MNSFEAHVTAVGRINERMAMIKGDLARTVVDVTSRIGAWTNAEPKFDRYVP
jgi:hypothetical protein